MPIDQLALLVGVFTPLAVAALSLILSDRYGINARDILGPIGAVITFIAALVVAGAVQDGTTPSVTLFYILGWAEFGLRVTPPGAVFGLVASGLWIASSVYSIGYMRADHDPRPDREARIARFNACYAIAIFAAMGIAWSGDLLTLFIFYEILTFSTYPLVIHKGTPEAIRAGRLYLGLLVGTSFILLLPAILSVWLITGTLEYRPGGILADSDPLAVPFLVFLFAFGIGKSALMPFHRWLPAAMVAPTPVSALLHAVAVVKAGVFSMLMVMVYIFGIDFLAATGAALWLVWLAAFTILAASVVALTKDDLKARLAYSTVSQLAYIVLAAALASRLAAEAGLLHIVMHASAKITLFFCAGAIYIGAHLKKVSDLDGLGAKMPMVFIAFFIASLSIIGIPPLGGMWSKLMLMGGAMEAGMWLMLVVLGISTLLNIYYLFEPPFRAFFRPMKKTVQCHAPILTVWPPVATAGLCVLLFFMVGWLTPFTTLMAVK